MLYIDMDGILTNLVGDLSILLDETPDFSHGYDLAQAFSLPPDELWDIIRCEGESFWSNMTPIESGLQFLLHLRNINVHFCILTSPTWEPDCLSGKLKWLHKVFGHTFRDYIITPHKSLVAHKGDILIDDSESNCVYWEKKNGTSCLAPRPWNDAKSGAIHIPLKRGSIKWEF